jgi:hypothetical protein
MYETGFRMVIEEVGYGALYYVMERRQSQICKSYSGSKGQECKVWCYPKERPHTLSYKSDIQNSHMAVVFYRLTDSSHYYSFLWFGLRRFNFCNDSC